MEASKRDLSEPVQLPSRRIIREDRDETLYRTYLYWTLSPEWAVAGEFSLDLYDSDHGVGSNLPTEVETRSAPLSVRYFSPLGFFSVLTGTFVDQHVHRPEGTRGKRYFLPR